MTARRGKLLASRRMKCSRFRRSSQNRGQCEHEAASAKGTELIGSFNDPNVSAEAAQTGMRIDYKSTLPGRIVPCPSDSEATIEMLPMINEFRKKTRWSR